MLMAAMSPTDLFLIPAAILLGGGWLAALLLVVLAALLGIRAAAMGLVIYAIAVLLILSHAT
jgi:hypothetical protein